jgi:hypothetical protein
MPAIPAFGRHMQDDCEFKDSLGYTERPSLNQLRAQWYSVVKCLSGMVLDKTRYHQNTKTTLAYRTTIYTFVRMYTNTWVWWYTPVIPAPRKLSQENYKFEVGIW